MTVFWYFQLQSLQIEIILSVDNFSGYSHSQGCNLQ